MRYFFRLLNYTILQHIRGVALICLGTFVAPLIFLNSTTHSYAKLYERFEDIYASSGCIIVFIVFFAALCGLCIKSVYDNYSSSKSIYTLMTLPVKREVIYFSRLTAFVIFFLIFLAVQLLSVLIGYGLVAEKTAAIENVKLYLSNGLFLAFIRSEFLRILLPLGVEGMVSTVSMLIAVLSGLYYTVLCERSRKYWGFAPAAMTGFLIVNALNYRMNQAVNASVHRSAYIDSFLLLLFCGFFIWHSIKLLKKSAIV